MNIGTLKAWQDDKGFGFIQSDAFSKDVFIHISTLKHMSRPPKVGDRIHFDVEKQADGKLRACQCRIEGVIAKPVSKKHSSSRQSHRTGSTRGERRMYTIAALVIFGVFFSVYDRFSQKLPNGHKTAITQPINTGKIKTSFPSSRQFRCDGRQHCSQMTSRAEAKYFIQHCPNTKMDGDGDGIPCENDSRF